MKLKGYSINICNTADHFLSGPCIIGKDGLIDGIDNLDSTGWRWSSDGDPEAICERAIKEANAAIKRGKVPAESDEDTIEVAYVSDEYESATIYAYYVED